MNTLVQIGQNTINAMMVEMVVPRHRSIGHTAANSQISLDRKKKNTIMIKNS
jgi:hypothetical protein